MYDLGAGGGVVAFLFLGLLRGVLASSNVSRGPLRLGVEGVEGAGGGGGGGGGSVFLFLGLLRGVLASSITSRDPPRLGVEGG